VESNKHLNEAWPAAGSHPQTVPACLLGHSAAEHRGASGCLGQSVIISFHNCFKDHSVAIYGPSAIHEPQAE